MQAVDDVSRAPPVWRQHLLAEGGVVLVLAAWYFLSKSVADYIFPSPLAVARALLALFTDPEFALNTLASAVRVVLSVVVATLIGGALALLPFYAPATRVIVHGRIKPVLSAFPSLGWALLAVVWFDMSNATVVFVQVAILIPFCLINVSEGVTQLDPDLMEMGASFGRSRGRTFTRILLPLLYPYIVSAVRMSYGIAWKVALIAEVFGAPLGLGRLMFQAQQTANLPMIFATCMAIVMFFLLGEYVVLNRLLPRAGQAMPPPA